MTEKEKGLKNYKLVIFKNNFFLLKEICVFNKCCSSFYAIWEVTLSGACAMWLCILFPYSMKSRRNASLLQALGLHNVFNNKLSSSKAKKCSNYLHLFLILSILTKQKKMCFYGSPLSISLSMFCFFPLITHFLKYNRASLFILL